MSSQAEMCWNGENAKLAEVYDATAMLGTPFTVLLKNSVSLVIAEDGEVLETIIPDPDGLVKAVAQYRVLHERKLIIC